MTQTKTSIEEDNNKAKRSSNEKPLSLFPLTMDEALREVLQVKPPPKETERKPADKKSHK